MLNDGAHGLGLGAMKEEKLIGSAVVGSGQDLPFGVVGLKEIAALDFLNAQKLMRGGCSVEVVCNLLELVAVRRQEAELPLACRGLIKAVQKQGKASCVSAVMRRAGFDPRTTSWIAAMRHALLSEPRLCQRTTMSQPAL